MIARLSGTIIDKGVDHCILDVHGVGYLVHLPLLDLDRIPTVGDPAEVYVHTHVREDALQLFGFTTRGSRQLFERLIGVSGVGPKLALSALSVLEPAELQQALIAGDARVLGRIPGVGRKTAQRLALELGEKVASLDLGGTGPNTSASSASNAVLDDLALALANLGFAAKQTDRVLDALRPRAADGDDLEALLREALALLRSPGPKAS